MVLSMKNDDEDSSNGQLERITFESIAPEFTKFYQEFDSSLKETPFKNSSCSERCFVTFGISGAGKVRFSKSSPELGVFIFDSHVVRDIFYAARSSPH